MPGQGVWSFHLKAVGAREGVVSKECWVKSGSVPQCTGVSGWVEMLGSGRKSACRGYQFGRV